MSKLCMAAVAAVVAAAGSAQATVVFQNSNDNGFFTPFNSSNANTGIRYGDGGWLSGFQPDTFRLTSITLGMCVFGSSLVGSTDLEIVITDGDPSGQIFGSGGELYRTTISNIALPSTGASAMIPVTVTVPLPAVETLGGFNNIGWSVECKNFNSDGQFGFLCASTLSQSVGFYTNNASFYNGSSWSLFAFSGDPTFGVANFVTTLEIPAPASAGLLGLLGLGAARRRR